MPRHADRDRRATPFIPACATVNSVCEPQFWFERFIRMAIANSIACNRPITYQTAGNGNVFQQVTHLILAWPSGRCPHRYIRTENDRMTKAKRRVSRKLLKTVTIVVIALAPLIAAGSAEAYGGGFHGGGFTAVSVAEALVTGASGATDFGLVGFSEAFIPATMAPITLAITDTAPAI